jgi:hypothetical protein
MGEGLGADVTARATPSARERDTVQRDLWRRTAEVAGRLNRAHGELVEVAAQVIEGGHWGDGGFRSAEHYLVVRAGLSPAHARDVVAVAQRRVELPDARVALLRGRLSLDQVAVVAHHVPQSHQRSMTDLARHATVPQLRRAVSRHAFTVQADDGDDRTQHEQAQDAALDALSRSEQSHSEQRACARPELSMHYDRDGRFHLRYSAPATIGALVEQAVKEAKDALFVTRAKDVGPSETQADALTDATNGASTDRPSMDASGDRTSEATADRPSYADAIEEIANRSLASVGSTSRSAHYRVYVHLSTDGAWVGGRHAIPMPLVQRFLSDGVLQPVWETDGRPVSVGRDLRILPLRSRRLIEDRDRGCRFPGCTTTRFVEIHHLLDWARGGATDDDNLVSLCPFHHDAVTRGDVTMTGDPTRPDGLTVTTRQGLLVGPPGWRDLAPPPGGDPAPPAWSAAYEPPSGESARWTEIEIPPDAELPEALILAAR